MYEGYKNYAFNKKSKIFEPADDKSVGTDGKKRYFVSIMSESLIKKNVFFGFRKRTRVMFALYEVDCPSHPRRHSFSDSSRSRISLGEQRRRFDLCSLIESTTEAWVY